MSDDVNERFGNVIRAEFGTASSLEEVMPLPVVLGGMAPFKCTRCARVFSPVTWHVELDREVLCRYCAKVDPELAIWQEWADVMDAVDQMMQRAADLSERVVLAQMLERYAGHLARWRWPEEEPSEDGDFEILARPGSKSEVRVDGNLLGGVRGFTLTDHVNGFPELELELVLRSVPMDGKAVVTVPESTRETLIALGWTPPPEGDDRK